MKCVSERLPRFTRDTPDDILLTPLERQSLPNDGGIPWLKYLLWRRAKLQAVALLAGVLTAYQLCAHIPAMITYDDGTDGINDEKMKALEFAYHVSCMLAWVTVLGGSLWAICISMDWNRSRKCAFGTWLGYFLCAFLPWTVPWIMVIDSGPIAQDLDRWWRTASITAVTNELRPYANNITYEFNTTALYLQLPDDLKAALNNTGLENPHFDFKMEGQKVMMLMYYTYIVTLESVSSQMKNLWRLLVDMIIRTHSCYNTLKATVPPALALLPAFGRGAQIMKLMIPSSVVLGWLARLVPFIFYLPLAFAIMLVVSQLIGDPYLIAATLSFTVGRCVMYILLAPLTKIYTAKESVTAQAQLKSAMPCMWISTLFSVAALVFCVLFVHTCDSELCEIMDISGKLTVVTVSVFLMRFIANYLLLTIVSGDAILLVLFEMQNEEDAHTGSHQIYADNVRAACKVLSMGGHTINTGMVVVDLVHIDVVETPPQVPVQLHVNSSEHDAPQPPRMSENANHNQGPRLGPGSAVPVEPLAVAGVPVWPMHQQD